MKVQTSNGVTYEPCTCGRTKRDIEDLCAILEFRYKSLTFHGKVRNSANVLVACLRPGCRGNWSVKRVFAGKLPVMSYNDWLNQKNKESEPKQKCSISSCDSPASVMVEMKREVTVLDSNAKSYIPSTYMYFCPKHWLEYNKEKSNQES